MCIEENKEGKVLTIRSHSGLSGDMILAGLIKMNEICEEDLNGLLEKVHPDLTCCLKLIKKEVNHIYGWYAKIELPHQHEHRTLNDITGIISDSNMNDNAKDLAIETFTIIAGAEASVHGKKPDEIHFHEVGALDSILDICIACELFTRLNPSHFVVSPLPITDGFVKCAHGILPVPAPAVLELLEGIPVCSFEGRGETLTPTAIGLLRGLGAKFGPWPSMIIEKKALVYGSRVFNDATNGALFALGPKYSD